MSFWRQGVRRLDRAYFRLLWQAGRLDDHLYRRARRDVRRLRRLARRWERDGRLRVRSDLEAIDEFVGHARDYLVRFRPEVGLERVRRWATEVQERARLGSLSLEDIRTVYDNARGYLRVRMRLHRFPGVTLERAFETAIKALHYQSVTRAIVGGGRRGSTP